MDKNCAMTSRPPIIGLTGGIGSGKSTVAKILKEHGCVVADADENTKIVLARSEVQRQLVEWWGEKVLDQCGKVDRSMIAEIVFAHRDQLKRLESLIHPLVRELQDKTFENAQKDSNALVIDASLLMEAGIDKQCDAVIYVDSPHETRMKRVVSTRGWDETQFKNREAAQIGLDTKRTSADHIIINDGDIVHLEGQVESILSLIRNSIRY